MSRGFKGKFEIALNFPPFLIRIVFQRSLLYSNSLLFLYLVTIHDRDFISLFNWSDDQPEYPKKNLILFTSNCGFTPVYLNDGIKEISIEQIKLSGDRTLNNYLKSNLNRYKNKESTKKISLEIVSYYQKNILSKDSSGDINKYELATEVIFTINL